jgi:hypothetical protein
MPAPNSAPGRSLRLVKAIHTLAWAFLAGCVLAIPLLALQQRLLPALLAIAIVAVEVLVLAANGFRCPLTDVAAQFTDDRAANFDIYLPEWLARYNKQIFGSLYVLGILMTLAIWFRGAAN